MKFLAEGLKKYYTRKKNRIIFRGNISLHDLSLTLWQELEFSEIDTSVVSRVLQGKRLFSPKQLHTFCKIVSIQGAEKLDLFSRLAKDVLSRAGMNSMHIGIEHTHLASFISKQLQMLEKICTLDPLQGIEEKRAFISLVLSLK